MRPAFGWNKDQFTENLFIYLACQYCNAIKINMLNATFADANYVTLQNDETIVLQFLIAL
jgi:hypothetical protein